MDFRLPRPPFVPPRPPPPGVRPMPPFANPMNMAPQGRPLLNRPPRSFPRAGGPLPPPMFRGPPPPSAPPPPPPPILPPFAHQRPPPLIRPARFHQPFGFNRPAVPPFPPMFGDKFLLNGTKPRDFKHKMEAEFNKPWISPDMKDEILKKHKLHQKARKSKNPEVWDEFREQRNKVTSMLREAKLSFQGNSLQSKEKKFFCDTCDRAYENQEQLDEHLGQHVKCGREGCQFEAHTKIVDLHVKMQHESGYAPKIMQLKTPEEINQWREERKKNFPTLESIKQKQKENSDHKANGETINKNQPRINTKRKKNNRGRGFKYRMNRSMIPPGMPNRGPFPGRGLGPPFRGKMMAGRGRGRFGMNMPFLHLRSNPSINNGLRRFAGTANINNNQEMMDSSDNLPMKVALPIVANNKISFDENAPRIVPNLNADRMSYMFAADVDGDSDDGPIEEKIEYKINTETDEKKPTLGGALGLLMNNYGCDTESENESRKTQNKHRNQKRGRTKSSKIESDDRQKTGKIFSKTPVMVMRKHQMSLLEKLLAREIQHERNVILQCVQYVVQKNFFGIENGMR